MAEHKKILISLDKVFLKELDACCEAAHMKRSAFISRAIAFYMQERRREQVRQSMEKGYKEMGEINLGIACSCFHADCETVIGYEENLR